MAKTIIHVNQHKIRAREARPLTVKRARVQRNASQADIVVAGEVVASIIYRPDRPLSCGARVWVETPHHVVLKKAS